MAFTREELIEKVLNRLKDKELEIAKSIFSEIFARELLLVEE